MKHVMCKKMIMPVMAFLLVAAGVPVVHVQAGVTERISVNSEGEGGNGSSDNIDLRYLSGDGRYVAFTSSADNLVPDDLNSNPDVFVRDRATGATEIVSVSSSGARGEGASAFPEITPDGRYVVFRSTALNLDPHQTTNTAPYRTYVHDRTTGATEMVSVSNGGVPANVSCSFHSISNDGNIVAFSTYADNLVPEDTNGCEDVFMHDRRTGTTTLVSVNSAGVQGNCGPRYGSVRPSISGDGTRISFMSGSTNLVENDGNNEPDIFVRDLRTGETRIVSVGTDGAQGDRLSGEQNEISLNGRFVAFVSYANTLAMEDRDIYSDIFVHDLETGTTELVSVGFASSCLDPAINADGRHVAFRCGRDIYTRDRTKAVTELVSVNGADEPGDGTSWFPAISANGIVVGFRSVATNLVPDDTEGSQDIFVRERTEGLPASPIAVGLGPAGRGFTALMDPDAGYTVRQWPQIEWPAYNSAVGETRPAWCDLDGDGTSELLIGLGDGGGGWMELLDDTPGGYTHQVWLRVGWDGYNLANGETRPACGDLDGDGRDEIVAGLGPADGKGWVEVLDDALAGYAHLAWVHVEWPAYNMTSGETFPAVGDIDGDPAEELVLGLGSGGWVEVRDDASTGFAHAAWPRVKWKSYTSSNGETHPAICDLDGDGVSELVIGLGDGGEGWLNVLDPSADFSGKGGTPAEGGWVRAHWPSYNSLVGATWPACGNADGDLSDELIIGFGRYSAARGYMEVLDDIPSGMRNLAWPMVPWRGDGGTTRPALGE